MADESGVPAGTLVSGDRGIATMEEDDGEVGLLKHWAKTRKVLADVIFWSLLICLVIALLPLLPFLLLADGPTRRGPKESGFGIHF